MDVAHRTDGAPAATARDGVLLRGEELCIALDDGQVLLRGVNFTLKAGQRMAVAGPSGCGKTMLLRSVAGLIDLAGGRVMLKGRSAAEVGWPAFRRQVVLVDQRPVLLDATVRANLELPFRYRVTQMGVGAQRFDETEAVSLLERLHVEPHRLDQAAPSLSVGQQQRICLVRAMLLRPAVLLLDEPTSALDEPSRDAVEALVAERSQRHGMAALIVTHDSAQAERWCHTRLVLEPLGQELAADG